jgi:hypothetical protein
MTTRTESAHVAATADPFECLWSRLGKGSARAMRRLPYAHVGEIRRPYSWWRRILSRRCRKTTIRSKRMSRRESFVPTKIPACIRRRTGTTKLPVQ